MGAYENENRHTLNLPRMIEVRHMQHTVNPEAPDNCTSHMHVVSKPGVPIPRSCSRCKLGPCPFYTSTREASTGELIRTSTKAIPVPLAEPQAPAEPERMGYTSGPGEPVQSLTGALADAARRKDKPQAQGDNEPIPVHVYYQDGNFYDRRHPHGGMGNDFWRKWCARKAEFATDPYPVNIERPVPASVQRTEHTDAELIDRISAALLAVMSDSGVRFAPEPVEPAERYSFIMLVEAVQTYQNEMMRMMREAPRSHWERDEAELIGKLRRKMEGYGVAEFFTWPNGTADS